MTTAERWTCEGCEVSNERRWRVCDACGRPRPDLVDADRGRSAMQARTWWGGPEVPRAMRRPFGVVWLTASYAVVGFAVAVALALRHARVVADAHARGVPPVLSVLTLGALVASYAAAAHGLHERRPHGWIAAATLVFASIGHVLFAPDAAEVAGSVGYVPRVAGALVASSYAIYLLSPDPLEWCGLDPNHRLRPSLVALALATLLGTATVLFR